jgi:hypothetical protein
VNNPQNALQQAVQNFVAQNPQAVNIPPGQFVAAAQAGPPAVPPPQSRRALIAAELQSFMNVYPDANTIAANLPGALIQFTQNMGNVGIVFRQDNQSARNNPGVDPFHVRELIDMLSTLNNRQAAFQADRFWHKLVTMRDIMLQPDETDDDTDSDNNS